MTSIADRDVIRVDALVEQLEQLGVQRGGVLLVHTSFRAVRPVQHGPEGLIDALTRAVGPSGTIVMPAWPDHISGAFDPASTPVATDLGVVAGVFWQLPGTRRTKHVQAFAARGPHADRILADPLPLPPHIPASPVGRVHELDGQVVLLGVNHDSDTTIHLVEVLAGVPYGIEHTCQDIVDGRVTTVRYLENDHCCSRFRIADDWLREAGLQREGRVGHAHSRLIRSRDIVETVVPRLTRDPLFFLHSPSDGCQECDEARSNVPVT